VPGESRSRRANAMSRGASVGAMSKAAIVSAPGAAYELVERAVPMPGPNEVLIRMVACGYCHSDENIRNGWIGNAFPRVPGHEAAGVIEAVGDRVPSVWTEGDRVGVGWHGGHCLSCDSCRAGRFLKCVKRQGCGSSFDGGFAEHMVAPHTALARIPAEVSFETAGPIMCAGITVWNGLRRTGAGPGDLVAVQGLGGLGHLAIQYADKMGFETVAISRGAEKETLAQQLGATHFIDSTRDDAASVLQTLGGATGILCTVPSGAAMNPLFPGLGPDGRMAVVGVSSEPISQPAHEFLGNDKGIVGSVIGTPFEIERLLHFGAVKGVAPMIETFALAEIATAQERLLANQMRFRGVFTF
jgi:D-arabinose 1-dehydrogenase-like Zn-dependent alcohol dehydrogenase